MVRDIDDLADERTRGIRSAGEDYYDTFLLKRPKTEWSPFIDETAKDLSAGVQVSDLNLSRDNFGEEIGYYYRRGLKKTAGRYADLPTVLEQKVSDQKLGLLAYQLNELSYKITTTSLGIDDVEKATEAVIEKLLTRHVGSDLNFSFELTGGTVADIATQLFRSEAVAANVDILLTEFEKSASQGLFSLMDEPQMMTPLWDHQREALLQWAEHDKRGYVDMATATGKTVLGLGALALKCGELHPDTARLSLRGSVLGRPYLVTILMSGGGGSKISTNLAVFTEVFEHLPGVDERRICPWEQETMTENLITTRNSRSRQFPTVSQRCQRFRSTTQASRINKA